MAFRMAIKLSLASLHVIRCVNTELTTAVNPLTFSFCIWVAKVENLTMSINTIVLNIYAFLTRCLACVGETKPPVLIICKIDILVGKWWSTEPHQQNQSDSNIARFVQCPLASSNLLMIKSFCC